MSYVQLKWLKATNFRSWSSLDFSFEKKGLTLLYGKNGAGKSSIRLAVHYALFGKVKSIPVNDLIREGSTTMSATVGVTIGKRDMEFYRSRIISSNGKIKTKFSIKINNKVKAYKNDSKVVEAILGYPKEITESLLSLSPDVLSFVDAKDFERKAYFEKIIPIIGLLRKEGKEMLVLKGNSLASKVQGLESKKVVAETKLGINEGNIKVVENDIYNHKIHITTLKKELKELRNTMKDKGDLDFDSLAEEIDEKIGDLVKKQDTIQAALLKIKLSKGELEGVLSLVEKYKKKLLLKKVDIEKLEIDISNVDSSVKNKVCKWCGSEITDFGFMLDKKKYLIKRKKEVNKEMEQINQKLEAQPLDIKKELKEADKFIEKKNDLYFKVRDQFHKLVSEKTSLFESKTLFATIECLSSEIDAYSKKSIGKESKIKLTKLHELINDCKIYIDKCEKMLNRLVVLEARVKHAMEFIYSLLPNRIISDALSKLTSVSQILYSKVESKGNLSFVFDGSTIQVKVTGRLFSQLSTGEKQLVRVISCFAWHILLCQQFNAVRFNVLFIDEILGSYLDEDYLDALNTFLGTEIKILFETLLLMTHNQSILSKVCYDNLIQVSKVKGISTLG